MCRSSCGPESFSWQKLFSPMLAGFFFTQKMNLIERSLNYAICVSFFPMYFNFCNFHGNVAWLRKVRSPKGTSKNEPYPAGKGWRALEWKPWLLQLNYTKLSHFWEMSDGSKWFKQLLSQFVGKEKKQYKFFSPCSHLGFQSQMSRYARWKQIWTTLTSRWQQRRRRSCVTMWWLTCTPLPTAVQKLQPSFTLEQLPAT